MHSWMGPDTTSNQTPGFVPIFWFFHSNIDRLFEKWLGLHPFAKATPGYPLKPFVGKERLTLDKSDPREWVYTNIGDTMTDSRSWGYVYGDPEHADPSGPLPVIGKNMNLYLEFKNVKCTIDSYKVRVFADVADPQPGDTVNDPNTNINFLQILGTRSIVGMGENDSRGRCITIATSRHLNATAAAAVAQIFPGDDVQDSISWLARNLTTRQWLTKAQTATVPGLVPTAHWGPVPAEAATRASISTARGCPTGVCPMSAPSSSS